MKASVVIVSYNRPEHLKSLINQINHINPEVELVVIDQTESTPNLCKGRNEGIA